LGLRGIRSTYLTSRETVSFSRGFTLLKFCQFAIYHNLTTGRDKNAVVTSPVIIPRVELNGDKRNSLTLPCFDKGMTIFINYVLLSGRMKLVRNVEEFKMKLRCEAQEFKMTLKCHVQEFKIKLKCNVQEFKMNPRCDVQEFKMNPKCNV